MAGQTCDAIGRLGLLVLVAVVRDDTEASADRLLEPCWAIDVFPDDAG